MSLASVLTIDKFSSVGFAQNVNEAVINLCGFTNPLVVGSRQAIGEVEPGPHLQILTVSTDDLLELSGRRLRVKIGKESFRIVDIPLCRSLGRR